MPTETIEHPVAGWNEVPREPGMYAWWDGQDFTTIAFRTDDHWEYVTDWQPLPPSGRQRNPYVWVGLWLGIASVTLLVAVGILLGPTAITLGALGMTRANRGRERVASIFAIVLGVCGMLLGTLVLWMANESM